MNNKEMFDLYKRNGMLKTYTAEMRIQSLINFLIEALYIPVKQARLLSRVDTKRIKHFKIDDSEPINWGDLKCNEVIKLNDNQYKAIVDEASPNECESLCEYLESYLKSWGWDVVVETEW